MPPGPPFTYVRTSRLWGVVVRDANMPGSLPHSSRLFTMWAIVVRHGGRCATQHPAPSKRKPFQGLRASQRPPASAKDADGRHQPTRSTPLVMLRVRPLSRSPYVFAYRTPVSCVSQPSPGDPNHGISFSPPPPSARSSQGARLLHHTGDGFVLLSPANLVRSPLTTRPVCRPFVAIQIQKPRLFAPYTTRAI